MRTEDDRERAQPPPAGTAARYLYGVTSPSFDVTPLHDAFELPVVAVDAAGLRAVASVVPCEDEGRDLADPSDLAWLERRARTHDAVVNWIAEAGDVVPVRFGIALPDEAAVSDLLQRSHQQLIAQLAQVTGAAEWSVRLRRVRSPEPTEPSDVGGPGGAGAAYLRRRGAERAATERAGERLDAAVRDAHALLAGWARQTAVVPPPRFGSPDDSRVFHGAYLVERGAVDDFATAVGQARDRVAADGVDLEVSGPLAPHHFVEAELGGGPVDGASGE